ncbi:TetR/AcrR family transcriptional regulator [Paenibacillus radicis (ex Xue et al. 2023)]|uniref:TetR/AcrR family transcriptional regulator n=1 Tax=Paenibacillus radicis (ex Xue et al. 2023) TaxID=2972489 RepID=A0ABT1YJA9_9BACL|nr:TetR/AcrR family transcriptional regulator [Paenibacillus radicis (ex Xue et al. 2023)]MCR8632810.1 TetR/AcrR family transcriptional regulator [Paenibacillus radicis (ex Xue et al. 2023)]
MPPTAVITEEKILKAAFEIVRVQGLEYLTARNIAQKLNCSTQPVYRIYDNMDEVKDRVYGMAVSLMRDQIFSHQDDQNSPALNMAIGFLHFAKQERYIFQFVYLSGYKSFDLSHEVFMGDTLSMKSMLHSERFRAIDEKKQKNIFIKISIYLTGIGTMINSGTLKMDFHETIEMVREMYEALLSYEGRPQS